MSGVPAQEYFSDGITDDLITDLSRIPGLFVIARSSAFSYKGKSPRVQDVGRDLGVRYILEGSVRRTGNEVRITAALADAESGVELWAESYDRPLRDIFSMQDQIVQRILSTLRLRLTLLQRGFPTEVPHETENMKAYDYFLQAATPYYSGTKQGMATAREMDEKAIALDPKYSYAYAQMGFTYTADLINGWNTDPEDLQRASESAKKAIALDGNDAWGYYLLSQIDMIEHHYSDAITDAQKGIPLDPSDPWGYQRLADPLIQTGRLNDALQSLKHAVRLDPNGADVFRGTMALTYTLLGRFDDAISAGKLHLAKYPNSWWVHLLLVVAYTELGDATQASAEAAEVMLLQPNFSLKQIKPFPWQRQTEFERGIIDMRKAGLK